MTKTLSVTLILISITLYCYNQLNEKNPKINVINVEKTYKGPLVVLNNLNPRNFHNIRNNPKVETNSKMLCLKKLVQIRTLIPIK